MKQKYDGYRIRLKQLLFSMLLFLMISALPLSFLMWSASGNDAFTVLAEEENEGEEEKTLVITVVERTEAEDIEENEIPLAEKLQTLYEKLEKEDLDFLYSSYFTTCERFLVVPRKQEVYAVINRMRKIHYKKGE